MHLNIYITFFTFHIFFIESKKQQQNITQENRGM